MSEELLDLVECCPVVDERAGKAVAANRESGWYGNSVRSHSVKNGQSNDRNNFQRGLDIPSPQYETDHSYSVTGYGVTIDDAAKMAIRAMIDYIVDQTGMSRTEAYVLASLSADLKIAETVDVPHMLVTMTIPKHIF